MRSWTRGLGRLICAMVAGAGSGLVAGALPAGASGLSGTAKVTLPGRPTAVFAAPTDGGAIVRWTAPVATAGGVTAYRVTAAPGSATCVTTGSMACTISGLADGTAYSVTVAAQAATGWGKPSTAAKVAPSVVSCAAVEAGGNLQGCDLARRDLRRARLTRGTNARITDLQGAVLGPVPATAARRFQAAPTGGADLAGADLDGVVSGGIVGDPSLLPPGWIVADGYLVGPGADLAGADLAGADLTGAYLDGTVLTGADVDGTVFPLDEPDPGFPNVDFTGMVSGGLVGTPTQLPRDNLLIDGYLVGPGAELAGADLAGADLGKPDLAGADVAGADLRGADLAGVTGASVTFSAADLDGADVRGAELPAATFYNTQADYLPGTTERRCPGYTDLGADWSGTVLTGAQFGCDDFTGADLTGVDLTGADSGGGENFNTLEGSGGSIGNPVAMPVGWELVDGDVIGPGAHIAELDLSGADLAGIDLVGSTVVIVDLTGADLTGADLSGLFLDGVQLDGADLTGADLSGVTTLGQGQFATTFVGTVWSDTTCPDGTNSDSDGGTCAGDLG
jgi:uncharacterized protein YjbI with pentapeptide repeats